VDVSEGESSAVFSLKDCGIRLVAQKVKASYLVIEKIEKPTEN
jgi:hypothetical protein